MTRLTQGLGRARAAWRVLWRSRDLEREMRDELRFHLELETERLVREAGLDPQEARRQAHVRFGGLEPYKEEARDARGRRWLDALSIDLRLAVRLLVKHRGLTLVGGLAMAIAIGIGATAFEALGEWLTPALPFEDGDRIVSITIRSSPRADDDGALGVLDDGDSMRPGLATLDEVGAFRTVQHNLVAPPAPPEPIRAAEMTASGFAITRVRPLLGRYLLVADGRPGAPPVVVIGYRMWQSRFAGDPQVVGRVLHLGGVARTIVGVMPDGFEFPYNHQLWLPFAPARADRRSGSGLYRFGRLAHGASMAQAEAELAGLVVDGPGAASSAERPRVSVVPYTRAHVDVSDPEFVWVLRLAQLVTGLLTFVVAVNLAILVYARTVTRAGELAVRAALGASRRRLVGQLFLEALALSLVGTAGGLGFAAVALRYLRSLAQAAGGVPYWIPFELSVTTVLDALALAVVAAVVIGVVPGLRVTAAGSSTHLHASGGRSSPGLGRLWTMLVVAQVASAVAVLPAAFYVAWQTALLELRGPGFEADRFAIASVTLPEDANRVVIVTTEEQERAERADARARARQVEARLRPLLSRFLAEPGVSAVTFSSYVPGFAAGARLTFHPQSPVRVPGPWEVSRLEVGVDLLDVYGAELAAGRRFVTADLGAANAVVVNETFARWFNGSAPAVGARFRYEAQVGRAVSDSPWYEIVGVVGDFPRVPDALSLDTPAVVYHPAPLGEVNPLILTIRFGGAAPAAFTERARRLAAAIDPALQLRQAVRLSDFYDRTYGLWRYAAAITALAALSALLLSAAGMYALMSFIVARRTREIGIRVALGARPRQLFSSLFGRALGQVILGVAAGSSVSLLAMSLVDLDASVALGLLLAVASVMLVAGLVAAVGPARHSLGIQASDALRADG
jgi:predicted permease